jgi:hypothetical protein
VIEATKAAVTEGDAKLASELLAGHYVRIRVKDTGAPNAMAGRVLTGTETRNAAAVGA